jgi:hypothetical protein
VQGPARGQQAQGAARKFSASRLRKYLSPGLLDEMVQWMK